MLMPINQLPLPSGIPVSKKGKDAIRGNRTFQIVEHKPHVIPSRYVSRVKNDARPEVRILAKGFQQVPEVEYQNTNALVVSFAVVRLFLCVVNLLAFDCDHMEVTFLNVDLKE